MVDVSDKSPTQRTATAGARVEMHPKTFDLLRNVLLQNKPSAISKKGDVLTIAKLAGIMAAKQTSNLIPLCHPISLSVVDVQLALNEEDKAVDIRCTCRCMAATGVEMEALTGATIAGLTVYDMCKAVDKEMRMTNVRLLAKSGGRSGDFRAQE